MPQILPDDEITEGINFLNSKLKQFFNVVHTYKSHIHVFFSGSGGTGKSHLVKPIYNAISKTMLYHCKDPKNRRFLFFGSTGMSAVNIGGITIHSGFGIEPGIKLLGWNNKSKAALRNRLSQVKFLIVDEISMASSNGQILTQGREK